MRILSINMNDFGGTNNHLLEHKTYNAWTDRECIDWKYWSSIDKRNVFELFLNYLSEIEPNILIINEMIVSSLEEIDFISKIRERGYLYFDECIPKGGKYSFTMMFYKNIECTLLESPNKGYKENRTIQYSCEGIRIIGTHFPPESNTTFLKAIDNFCTANINEKVIIMGDLNANDPTRGNKQMVEKMIAYGYRDVWIQRGNPSNTPTEIKYGGRLDYVISSNSIYDEITNIKIDPKTMESGMTDHAALIIDL